ncbi:MAG TPA: PIN domain-containing protein [Thermoanaerobaculia bacterium]|nr:PIN domain-containing protein [Thermoanaerobaculia bacterium]
MTPPAVVDTNVVVSGLLTGDEEAPTAVVLSGMLRRRFRFLLSVDLLAEYRSVLLRPAIRGRHGMPEGDLDDLLAEIAALAEVRHVSAVSDRERHADRHVRLLLFSCPGAVLVTGDEALRRSLPTGVEALSPRTFAARIR